MKSKFFYVCALVAMLGMAACSSDKEEGTGETADLSFTVDFNGVVNETRATKSTYIPATSWANISQLQVFVYETGTKTIRHSAVITTGFTGTAQKLITCANIPKGNTYDIVVVANANTANHVSTFGTNGSTAEAWTESNVRSKNATNMIIKHLQGAAAFPAFVGTQLTGQTAYENPGEIFMGSAASVPVNNTMTLPNPIDLTREVSMMRVRIDATTLPVPTTVNMAEKNSIMVKYLPVEMGILAGNTGGLKNQNSEATAWYSSTANYLTANPSGSTVLTDNFKYYNDLIVFPNHDGRADVVTLPETVPSVPIKDKSYYIYVTAEAKAGHKYADGTTAAAGDAIYWGGWIKAKFYPNFIRDVNVFLKTGGQKTINPDPVETVDLEIKVNAPQAWNANILQVDVEV